jgi:hypothetical protein
MLKIDRLVLRLPDEYSGRGRDLSRAIGAALAQYRPAQGPRAARESAPMSDAAISQNVVRAVAARIGKPGRGSGGASS